MASITEAAGNAKHGRVLGRGPKIENFSPKSVVWVSGLLLNSQTGATEH